MLYINTMLKYTLFVFLSVLHIASASTGFDFGDFLALVIGLAIAIVGICACLGCYARKQNFEAL